MDVSQLAFKKKILFSLLTLLLVVILGLGLGEILLRLVPIPGVRFWPLKYSRLNGRAFYPNSVVTYRNDRGDFVKKKVNRWGYLDKDHGQNKPEGVYRIGFFGDSYTEALQVPNEETFFQLIESQLYDEKIECLGFGHSGLGTAQSYLVSQKEATFFDLDMVVYVFVENDIGDNIREIKRDPNMPYAKIVNQRVVMDTSFRERNAFREKWFYDLYYYLGARSLLFSTLKERLKLLLEYGIKTKVEKEDRLMATKFSSLSKNAFPNQNDLPSTWPDSLRSYALRLDSLLLLKWKMEMEEKSKDFVVFYVPRESEWQKETKDQDSWKGWLDRVCKNLNINFIDPTPYFKQSASEGKEIFYDHFTREGHIAFAKSFVKWFKQYHETK